MYTVCHSAPYTPPHSAPYPPHILHHIPPHIPPPLLQDEEASTDKMGVKGFRERMRNHLSKESKTTEDEDEAARAAAMHTIVVPGKHNMGNVMLDISYFPFEYVVLIVLALIVLALS